MLAESTVRVLNHAGLSRLAHGYQAAAPTLAPLNTAALPETEAHVDDTKVVESQPAQNTTDQLPQRHIGLSGINVGSTTRHQERRTDHKSCIAQ